MVFTRFSGRTDTLTHRRTDPTAPFLNGDRSIKSCYHARISLDSGFRVNIVELAVGRTDDISVTWSCAGWRIMGRCKWQEMTTCLTVTVLLLLLCFIITFTKQSYLLTRPHLN